MKPIVTAFGAMLLVTSADFSLAEECNYNWILANTDGSKPTKEQYDEKQSREQQCAKRIADEKHRAANARTRLKKEFEVDDSGLSDAEAVVRLEEEIDNRRREQEEAENRRQEAAEQKRMGDIQQLMDKQDKMLQGLGVNMGGPAAASGGDSNESDIDPIELQMYQKMVDEGVAPQCKGKKGEALIDCVDAAIDEKEKN